MKKTLIIFLIILLILIILPASASGKNTLLSSTKTVGGGARVTLYLDSAPNGLSGYNIGLHLKDPKSADISKVKFPKWTALNKSEHQNGSIRIEAVDLNKKVEENSKNVTIATIKIANITPPTELDIKVFSIDNDKGKEMHPTVNPIKIQKAGKKTKNLSIVGPTDVTAGETVTYLIKADEEPVEADIKVNGESYTTDANGYIDVTFGKPGNYIVTATKADKTTATTVVNYTSTTLSVNVTKKKVTKNLSISVQTPRANRKVGKKITFKVTADGQGVEATVTVAGTTKTTSADGTITFTFDEAGATIVSANKDKVETPTTVTTYTNASTSVEIQKTPGFTATLAITGILGVALLIYHRKHDKA